VAVLTDTQIGGAGPFTWARGGVSFFNYTAGGQIRGETFYYGTDTPTQSHIHIGAVGATGAVAYDLCGSGTAPACQPSIFTSSNAEDSTKTHDLNYGNSYVAVHTTKAPGGELRGQLYQLRGAPLLGKLNTPERSADFTASLLSEAGAAPQGLATLRYDKTGKVLRVFMAHTLVDVTVAHIHGPGKLPAGAPILFILALAPNGYLNPILGSKPDINAGVVLTAEQENWLLTGQLYLAIHQDPPSNAIAGQINDATVAGTPRWTALLTDSQQVPALASSVVTRVGVAHIYRSGGKLRTQIIASGMMSAVTAVHIHAGDFGANGGVSYTICDGSLACASPLINVENAEADTRVMDSPTYLNVHTSSFPGGEIRGQVQVVASQPKPPTPSSSSSSTGGPGPGPSSTGAAE